MRPLNRSRMGRLLFMLQGKGKQIFIETCLPVPVYFYTYPMPFDEKYFSTNTYANISFAKYSQYWWSNRFYAMLVRRYDNHGSRLLEIGSGLGHLVAQLEDSFSTHGLDVNYWAVRQSKSVVRATHLQTASAQEIPFADHSFNVVIIKHIVEHL